jgi:hypothetical protein
MGKQEVRYSCGHDGVLNLYGPHKERDSKVAWLEREGLCPDCYRKKQAEDIARLKAESPKNALLLLKMFQGDSRIKDTERLDAMVAWMQSKACDFTSSNFLNPPKFADPSLLKEIFFEFKQRGYVVGVTLVEPIKPKCYPAGTWNGKFYGSEKFGYSIYVDGGKENIEKTEKKAIEKYLADIADYRAALADVKKGKLDSELVQRFRAPAPESPAPAPAPAPESPAPAPKKAYDRPMAMPVPAPVQVALSRNVQEIRSAVCKLAWVYIRQGKSKSEAFKKAWKIIKEGNA